MQDGCKREREWEGKIDGKGCKRVRVDVKEREVDRKREVERGKTETGTHTVVCACTQGDIKELNRYIDKAIRKREVNTQKRRKLRKERDNERKVGLAFPRTS